MFGYGDPLLAKWGGAIPVCRPPSHASLTSNSLTVILCAVALVLLATGLSVTTALAHGVVGDYVFLEPIITQDPTPANELDILAPSWVKTRDANNYAVGFSVEKV